ncbi:hypothetical protein BG74_06180 [Sodalis-like endosymbiont of Proechinophthirus fluctus]|nr:hypothetical protein BG74_06180 [Sodalis-like endosymbiont of Proechinophthirus fluctus]
MTGASTLEKQAPLHFSPWYSNDEIIFLIRAAHLFIVTNLSAAIAGTYSAPFTKESPMALATIYTLGLIGIRVTIYHGGDNI